MAAEGKGLKKQGPRGAQLAVTPAQRRETAEYISELALQMRNLAKSSELLTLQALLEIAYYEAFGIANAVQIPADELARIRGLAQASHD